MQFEMISVRCPKCSKSDSIKIDTTKISKNPRGVTAINIAEDLICNHSMVVYIDRNAVVRDCFVADFTIDLPEIELEQKIDKSLLPDKKLVNVYLLTINLNPQFLARVIRSCLLKKEVLILNELDVLNNHISNFFNYIFQDTFKIDISLLNKRDYKKQKKKYKQHVIVDTNEVIQDKSGILKPKFMKIENRIVQKFLEEPDTKSSLIIIKNEILKSYELSNSTHKFYETLKEGSPLKAMELYEYLKKIYHNIRIETSYLSLLVEIIEQQNKILIPDAADRLTSF